MKIKFKDVEPGMVVRGNKHFGMVVMLNHDLDFFNNKPHVEMFSAEDSYYGSGLSEIDPYEEVEVIEREAKEKILKSIRNDLNDAIEHNTKSLGWMEKIQ